MKDIDRFMNKIKKLPNGCWEWQKTKHADGYGKFFYKSRHWGAHRWIYEYTYGPTDLFICHKCDNPSCVNPAHLFTGTHQDNMRDKVSKNRQSKGEVAGRAKITEQDAIYIKYNSDNLTCDDLAIKFNLSPSAINHIRKGRNWKHI